VDLAEILIVVASFFILTGVALTLIANSQLNGMYEHMRYYHPNHLSKLGVGNASVAPISRKALVFRFFTRSQYAELDDARLERRARRTLVIASVAAMDLLVGLGVGVAAYRQVITV